MRPHQGFLVVRERGAHLEVAFALFAEIGSNLLHRPPDTLFAEQRSFRDRLRAGNFLLDGSVILAESGGGLNGLTQNVALAETGYIVGRKAQAKLVRGAMGAEQLQLGVLQFRRSEE